MPQRITWNILHLHEMCIRWILVVLAFQQVDYFYISL